MQHQLAQRQADDLTPIAEETDLPDEIRPLLRELLTADRDRAVALINLILAEQRADIGRLQRDANPARLGHLEGCQRHGPPVLLERPPQRRSLSRGARAKDGVEEVVDDQHLHDSGSPTASHRP